MLLFILEPSWKSCRCPAIRTGKQCVAISTTGVGHQDSAEKRTHEKSEDWQAGRTSCEAAPGNMMRSFSQMHRD